MRTAMRPSIPKLSILRWAGGSLLSILGLAGVPEDLATWAGWAADLGRYTSHEAVRTLLVAVGVAVVALPRIIQLAGHFFQPGTHAPDPVSAIVRRSPPGQVRSLAEIHQATVDNQGNVPKPLEQTLRPAMVVTDRTGEQTSLIEFGILYDPYGRGLAAAMRDGLIVERGAGGETFAWTNIECVEVTSPAQTSVPESVPLVATVATRDGANMVDLRLRSGTIVGSTAQGSTFTLGLADSKRISLTRTAG
jgi:hypothetical protein